MNINQVRLPLMNFSGNFINVIDMEDRVNKELRYKVDEYIGSESRKLEFKDIHGKGLDNFLDVRSKNKNKRSLCEYVSGFLNTEEGDGKIFIGVNDDGRVVGINCNHGKRDKLNRNISTIMGKQLTPQVILEQYKVDFIQVVNENGYPVDDLYVLEISINRKTNIKFLYKARGYVYRRDNGCLLGPLQPDEVTHCLEMMQNFNEQKRQNLDAEVIYHRNELDRKTEEIRNLTDKLKREQVLRIKAENDLKEKEKESEKNKKTKDFLHKSLKAATEEQKLGKIKQKQLENRLESMNQTKKQDENDIQKLEDELNKVKQKLHQDEGEVENIEANLREVEQKLQYNEEEKINLNRSLEAAKQREETERKAKEIIEKEKEIIEKDKAKLKASLLAAKQREQDERRKKEILEEEQAELKTSLLAAKQRERDEKREKEQIETENIDLQHKLVTMEKKSRKNAKDESRVCTIS